MNHVKFTINLAGSALRKENSYCTKLKLFFFKVLKFQLFVIFLQILVFFLVLFLLIRSAPVSLFQELQA